MPPEYVEGQKYTGITTDHAWHADCELEFRGTHPNGDHYVQSWWCEKHGQWTYQFPIKTIWIFNDGRAVIREKKQLSEDKGAKNN